MNKLLKVVGLLTIVSVAGAGLSAGTKITIKGSTTVLPIAQKTAEVFMDKNPGIDISVQGGGSGVGIAAIIDGTCDIGASSRPIKEAEVGTAVGRGRNPKANTIAMDGIAVIVNPANTVSALSKKQVKDIYTGKISDWSQLGGTAGKIVVISRDSASGTFEAFATLALTGAKVRSDALMQASNKAIASMVEQTPGAVGYVGLGYITSAVKALPVDGVEASPATVISGKYPYSRPLFMYTDGRPAGVVKQYIDFIQSPEGQKLVVEDGFVALQ